MFTMIFTMTFPVERVLYNPVAVIAPFMVNKPGFSEFGDVDQYVALGYASLSRKHFGRNAWMFNHQFHNFHLNFISLIFIMIFTMMFPVERGL
jgi:hypothetical protein